MYIKNNDFVEYDHIARIDDEISPTTYLENSILPIRNNVDEIINEQGQNLLDFCNGSKLCILNGRLMDDAVGYKTFYGPRGSGSINYILVSEDQLHTF